MATSEALGRNIAEPNPAIRDALTNHPEIADFTGDLLRDPKVHVIGYDGRLYLARAADRYDVIDLSLADSAGLFISSGTAITEKYNYTEEAMREYMHALKDGGVLSRVGVVDYSIGKGVAPGVFCIIETRHPRVLERRWRPQGLKPYIMATLSARLKPCP